MRVKSAVARHRKKKRYFKQAKGRWGGRRKLWRTVQETVRRGHQQAFHGRKRRKRDFRRLWITRIGAQARVHDLNYSTFIHGLREAGVEVNRKMLADLAVRDQAAFAELAETAKRALG